MRTYLRTLGVVLAVCTSLALSSCIPMGDVRTGVAITNDDNFIRGLNAAIRGGEQVPFRGLTDFDWQTVSVFGESTPPEEIEREVGKAVIDNRYFASGYFFVFCADGDIVAALAYPYPNLIFYAQNTFSTDLVVSAQGDLQDLGGTEVTSACK